MSDTAAFVLAGGQSSRMGQDKALVDLCGRPLVAWALEILAGAGLDGRIAGARSELSRFAQVVPDTEPDLGPLSGICAALSATAAERAVFLSVDMPFLPASLIVYLVRDAEITGSVVTLASINGFPQTFPAVVCRSALPALENELRQGSSGCFAGFRTAAGERLRVISAESLAQAGMVAHPRGLATVRWFANANSPVELTRMESW